VILESQDSVGGVWNFTHNRQFGGVMTTTETTSSRCITEISDFPMPEIYPNFPSHTEILAYLQAYCARFDLERHIKFRHQVLSVQKAENTWIVTCKNGSKYRGKKLINCSAIHRYINDVSTDTRFSLFEGSLIHSATIKTVFEEDYSGKTIVIWGGGESASDIAVEVSKWAETVYWCIPNGQWFLPKIVERWPPFQSDQPIVVDHTTSRIRLFLSPTHDFSPFISQYLEYTFGFNGHGVPAWKTNTPYNRSFLNKSSEVLTHLKSGRIIPKQDITYCKDNNVYFTDRDYTKADIIITCSGYRLEFPFFNEASDLYETNQQEWYKYIFPKDSSVAFIGFVRPVFGSIPGLAELQSRYVALVFSGKKVLPSLDDRVQTTRKDTMFWNHHFRFTSKRLTGLVDHFLYSDQLAELIGCRPHFWRLFLTSPHKWWVAVTSPWNGCQFWLNDESHHDRIFHTFARYRYHQGSEVTIFLLLAPILPFIRLWSRIRLFLVELFGYTRKSSPSKYLNKDDY